MQETITLGLNTPQWKALTSQSKITVFVAGLGVGKSIALGIWTQQQARRAPNTLGLIVASTKDQLRDSTWPQLQEAWEWMGVIEDEHYVLGRRPPSHWHVKPWHPSNNHGILTWAWGGYAKLGSTERFNLLRGGEPDYLAGDELRDWKRGAVPVLVGRLRGKAFKHAGIVSPAFFATTPPDDPDDIERYFDSEQVHVVTGTTFDNLKNLPPDYIDTQRGILDELTFRREILGELISVGGMKAAYGFDREKNVRARAFDPNRPLYLTWDFNSSQTRPMSTLFVQQFDDGDWVVHEEVNRGTVTLTQAEICLDWLKARDFRNSLHIRGDHTGSHGGRNSSTGLSDYRAIEQVFRSETQWHYEGRRSRATLRVKDRVASLNARFESWPDRKRHLFVDPSCKHTIAAMRKLKFKNNGYELEENEHREPFDALSYYTYFEYPVDRAKTTPVRMQ